MPDRLEWDEVWMSVAHSIALRSKCVRRQIGAVIVSPDNSQIWVGYNGPPADWHPQYSTGVTVTVGEGRNTVQHSSCDRWCERARGLSTEATAGYDNCVTIHAENNALIKSDPALRRGGTIYVTSFPCFGCAKMIANSGVKKVITEFDSDRDGHRLPELSRQMLNDSAVEVLIWQR